jgi:hypothetical protein
MNKKLLSGLVVVFSLFLFSSVALAANLYVDVDGFADSTGCGGSGVAYKHPQDAVNAANPGDTIYVCPGTYGSRCFTSPIPPHWGINDQCAPALIVWKNNLVIKAVDPNPANTIIQSTHNVWSNPAGGSGGGGAIEHSTGCTYNAGTGNWDGTCVRPTAGTAPNGIAIIANGVTIDGFTIRSTYGGDPGAPTQYPNTGGVLIGGLYSGDSSRSGISGTVIKNSIISGYSGVRLWKAPHTTLENNIIDNNVPPVASSTPEQAAVDVWDGWDQGTGSSFGLRLINNKITSYKNTWAVGLGGFLTIGQIDHSDLYIDGNTITSNDGGVHLWNSQGTNKVMTCNNIVNVAAGSKKILIESSTYDGPFGIDKDKDGYDMCTDCNDNNPLIGKCVTPTMSPFVMLALLGCLAVVGAKRIKV